MSGKLCNAFVVPLKPDYNTVTVAGNYKYILTPIILTGTRFTILLICNLLLAIIIFTTLLFYASKRGSTLAQGKNQ